MSKPVSLTVHRNNADRRRRKETRQYLKDDVAKALRNIEVSGFALVVWNDEHDADAYWHAGNLPGSVVPEFTVQTIRRRMGMMDTEEILDNQ